MISTITIDVSLDNNRIPEQISWKASESTADSYRKAKGMMLSFWDGEDKTAMRVDLWTKDMMVDEMTDFYYQTLITMADTYGRATHQDDMVEQMKNFAKEFYEKFRANQLKENKV